MDATARALAGHLIDQHCDTPTKDASVSESAQVIGGLDVDVDQLRAADLSANADVEIDAGAEIRRGP